MEITQSNLVIILLMLRVFVESLKSRGLLGAGPQKQYNSMNIV